MTTGRIPIIEVDETGRETNVGTFVWSGKAIGGTGRFYVNSRLPEDQQKQIRQRWATAVEAGATIEGPIMSVGNRRVQPWSGFLGNFEAIQISLPVVGLEIDNGSIEWPTFASHGDLRVEGRVAAEAEVLDYAEAVIIDEYNQEIKEEEARE